MIDDSIISRLRALISEHRPCGIEMVDGHAKCRGKSNDYVPCCTGCQHLTSGGCGISSPGCLFYFCVSAWEALPKSAQDEIKALGAAYKGDARLRGTGTDYRSASGFSLPYVWNKGDWQPRRI